MFAITIHVNDTPGVFSRDHMVVVAYGDYPSIRYTSTSVTVSLNTPRQQAASMIVNLLTNSAKEAMRKLELDGEEYDTLQNEMADLIGKRIIELTRDYPE